MTRAECAKNPPKRGEPDPFFPGRGESTEALRKARKMCDICPVSEHCKEYRFTTGSKYGIWAGEQFSPAQQ